MMFVLSRDVFTNGLAFRCAHGECPVALLPTKGLFANSSCTQRDETAFTSRTTSARREVALESDKKVDHGRPYGQWLQDPSTFRITPPR
jgi:hypothetical protein